MFMTVETSKYYIVEALSYNYGIKYRFIEEKHKKICIMNIQQH